MLQLYFLMQNIILREIPDGKTCQILPSSPGRNTGVVGVGGRQDGEENEQVPQQGKDLILEQDEKAYSLILHS